MLKVLLCLTILAYAQAATQQANVVLKSGDISGTVTFTQSGDSVRIQGEISGLPAGKHGFHIHEKGDLSNGCTSAGGHFNPLKKDHGAPTDDNRHIGDLGNIEANADKVAKFDFTDKLIALDGQFNIVGRAVVVHADPDDLGLGGQSDSKTTGHAGARLACGVIGIVSESGAITTTVNVLIFVTTLLVSQLKFF